MIDWHTPLGHHLFEIAVAHLVAAVPPHRPQDDVTGEMPTGEDAHGRDYFTPVFLLPQLCNSTIEFAKREDYWGAPAQRDAAIRYFADAVSAVSALRVGDIDVVWSMQAPELIETLPEAIGVEVGTTNGEMLLSLNNARAPFDDPYVRRAVAYAIDRDALNDIPYNGMATNTGGAPVPPTDPWYTGRDYYPFDPAKTAHGLVACLSTALIHRHGAP